MARDLILVHDALDQARSVSSGLEALVALMVSARESDMPSGKALAELIEPLQKVLDTAIGTAEEGLKQ